METNDFLPKETEIFVNYKALFDGETLNDNNEGLVNCFVIAVLPTAHVSHHAKNNYELGAHPLYSNYVTAYNKEFALFFIEHYILLHQQRIKARKSSPMSERGQDDKNQFMTKRKTRRKKMIRRDMILLVTMMPMQEIMTVIMMMLTIKERKKKRKYKKVNITQSEKDYQNQICQLNTIRKNGGKEAISNIKYCTKLMKKEFMSLSMLHRKLLMFMIAMKKKKRKQWFWIILVSQLVSDVIIMIRKKDLLICLHEYYMKYKMMSYNIHKLMPSNCIEKYYYTTVTVNLFEINKCFWKSIWNIE